MTWHEMLVCAGQQMEANKDPRHIAAERQASYIMLHHGTTPHVTVLVPHHYHPVMYGQFSQIWSRTIKKWGSQIPEPLLSFTSTCPSKVQISWGPGPISRIELLQTGRRLLCARSYTMICVILYYVYVYIVLHWLQLYTLSWYSTLYYIISYHILPAERAASRGVLCARSYIMTHAIYVYWIVWKSIIDVIVYNSTLYYIILRAGGLTGNALRPSCRISCSVTPTLFLGGETMAITIMQTLTMKLTRLIIMLLRILVY